MSRRVKLAFSPKIPVFSTGFAPLFCAIYPSGEAPVGKAVRTREPRVANLRCVSNISSPNGTYRGLKESISS